MKWTKKNITANEGVIFVQQEVNKHGSIFRPVHQETDIGIDGFIEYVESEIATGQLIAIQVKSGDSYLNSRKDGFVLSVDEKHLSYWDNFSIPVMLIFYSPTLNQSAYIEIKSFISHEKYHDRLPIRRIEANLSYRRFDAVSIGENFKGILEVYKDEKILLESTEKCLSSDIKKQKEGFLILSNHPFSRGRKITIYIAKQLLMSSDIELAKDALFTLGYGVGRGRWSWNPNNKEEKEIIEYASEICSELTEPEIRKVIELVEGEYWNGPEGLGERAVDILSCIENIEMILTDILHNKNYLLELRGFCLYLMHDCDIDLIVSSKKQIMKGNLKDVYSWITAG